MKIKNTSLKVKRQKHVRGKLRSHMSRLRLTVFRSLKYIYAQIIDDEKGKTIVAVNQKELNKEKNVSKTEIAFLVGKLLAEKAKKLKIEKVVFDRGSFAYHGRVKSLAEGAREGGLNF